MCLQSPLYAASYFVAGGIILGIFSALAEGTSYDIMSEPNPVPFFIIVGWPIAVLVLVGVAGYQLSKRVTQTIMAALK
jgi:hypothetical protein